MSTARSRCDKSVLVVVDMQPSFLAPIVGGDAVLEGCRFLAKAASVLGVPIVATEQYPERMGGTESELAALVGGSLGKTAFSACGAPGFAVRLGETGANQAVLCGIETPICVTQTALDLLDQGWEVFLATDAMGARSNAAHATALERMARAGAVLSQTESVVYEWMGSSDHPKFREVLALVKARP